jgi:Tfp pilus assembly protein PilX
MTVTKRRGGNESTVTRLRDAIVARVRGNDSENGVALLSAILFMVIMAGISVVLLSTVLGQIVPSTLAQRNTKTIYAAQAGVQASLAMLRSASKLDISGKPTGDPTKLVCSLTGRVDAQNDGLSYKADITYFTVDPNKTASPTPLQCTGLGVSGQPKYAKINSQGIAAPVAGVSSTPTGSRYLSAIYTFKITNINIPGGRIFDLNNNYCLEAVSATLGSNVKFTSKGNCSKAKDALQLWIYDTDYEIKLASTTAAGSTALCITGPQNKNDNNTQNATLTKCAAQQWNQLWSWMGSYTWQGQQFDITKGYSSYYLTGSFAEGNYLQVSTSISGTFNPTSAVGPGAASINTYQIVNYLEFGRCLDVTTERPDYAYMISYPCKQDPSGLSDASGNHPGTRNLNWNHKWYYNEPTPPATSSAKQTITVKYLNDPAQTYCLQAPPAAPAGSGPIYPTFKSCVASESLQKWVRVNNTGTYANSYLFVDSLGRCLSVGTNPNDLYGDPPTISKIVVATCDNSYAQKWNAPAATVGGTVGGYQEVAP